MIENHTFSLSACERIGMADQISITQFYYAECSNVILRVIIMENQLLSSLRIVSNEFLCLHLMFCCLAFSK